MNNTTKFLTICTFLVCIAAVIVMGSLAFSAMDGPATIAGTDVPSGLQCEEDEVISLLPSPHPPGTDFDKIGCVHIDTIGEAR